MVTTHTNVDKNKLACSNNDVSAVLKLFDCLQFFGSYIIRLLVTRAITIEFMNFCNLFALPGIPFRRKHRALLSVLEISKSVEMGEQAMGQSYDLREQCEEAIKSFKGYE